MVFIHNNYSDESILSEFERTGILILFNQNAAGAWIQRVIANGIAACAVPLFFLFAAFLQARKADPYPVLLKKKARSLLLPYTLWLAVYFLYFDVLKLLVATIAPQILGRPDMISMINANGPADWLRMLWGSYPAGPGRGPSIAGHFWFVRDLIALTVLSPAIIALLKKAPAATFGFVAGLYLLNLQAWFVATEALFFYTAGLLWGTREAPLLEAVDRVKWGEAAFLFAATFLCRYLVVKDGGTSTRLMIFSACLLMLKASKAIAENEKAFALAARLSRYSFFLYAIHELLLNALKKFWLILFPMKNAFFCLLEFFCVTFLAAAIAVAIGALLRKLLPPLFAVLNGGRSVS